jgi:hypothetical protein
VNIKLSKACAMLRILYVFGMLVGLTGLMLLEPEIYTYVELIAYAFFTGHILLLGYLVLRSNSIHRFFGIFLITAGFGFLVLTYGEYLIPEPIIGILLVIAMIPGAFAEVSLGVYLMIKEVRRSRKERNEASRSQIAISSA